MSYMFVYICFSFFLSLQLIRDVCDGELQGDAIGSEEITFTPKAIRSGEFLADTETAGYVKCQSLL